MKRPSFSILYREQPPWRWKPDSWIDRVDAWLWHHPGAQAFLGGIVVALMVGFCAYLFWCAPEVRP